jgi:hypothetical protein
MKIIHGNCRMIVREVAEEVEVSIGSCHTVLTEDLAMRWVPAKFVPTLDDLQSHLQRANEENVLINVITGCESWVCNYDVETKQ